MPQSKQSVNQTFRFGPYQVDAAAREVRNGSNVLKAPPKVFDLLLVLLENSHRVMPRQEILRLVWPRVVVSRGALPQSMLKLRKLLGGEQVSEQWIATVRGVGYRFIGEVCQQAGSADAVAAGPRSDASAERRHLVDDEVRHRVNVLNQQAQEQSIQLDADGLRRTIADLSDRRLCGADPRARVFAMTHQSVMDRRANDMDKAWQTIQSAEDLADQLADPDCQIAVLRAKGQFFLQYVSYGEAIPWFHRAFELASRQGSRFEAADCACFLAACMGRAGDVSGCEDWTQRAGQLARGVKPDWFWTYVWASLAGTHIHLGERAQDVDDLTQARRHWTRAVQMLDDADAAGDIAQLGSFAQVLPINRAWAQGYLFPERRSASIQALRGLLQTETLPQIQLSHLLGLTTFLIDEGRLEEARTFCDQGLALGDATKIFRHRVGFLSKSAEISSRQGRHADAVRQLKAQMKWQEETARADAVRIAKVTALRLQTERALAAAEVERGVALQLQAENEALKREARLRGTEGRFDQATGQLPMPMFRSWLVLTLARVKLRHQPLIMVVVLLAPNASRSEGRGASEPPRLAGLLGECLAAHLRVGDRWTQLDAWQLVVALGDVDLDRAQLVAARLRRDIVSVLNLDASDPQAIGIVAFDASQLPDVEAVMDRIRLSTPSASAALKS